jgi:hypothetical protein
MGGHSGPRGPRSLTLLVTLLVLAAPVTASANNPAEKQYVLPSPSATGSGGSGHDRNRLDPAAATTTGSGSGGATIAILAGGLAAIGGAAGIIVYRRWRDRSSESG